MQYLDPKPPGWHDYLIGAILPFWFDPAYGAPKPSVWSSCVVSGVLFAAAGVGSQVAWTRRLGGTLLRRKMLREAAIGFGIGSIGMPAGGWLRDNIRFQGSRLIKFVIDSTKKTFYSLQEQASQSEPSNRLRKNLTIIGFWANLIVQAIALYTPFWVVHALWIGGLYPLLLGSTLPRDHSVRLFPFIRKGIRNAALAFLIGIVPVTLFFAAIDVFLPQHGAKLNTLLYAALVVYLAYACGLRLRLHCKPSLMTK